MIPIIVLNLERAPQRKELIIQQFENLKMVQNSDYYFMSAFDGRYLTNLTFGANIGMGYGSGRLFQKAELSIIMSHISAIKFAQMMDFEEIIIIEDDVILCEDWNQRLDTLHQILPENWEYVYLSGHSDYVKFKIYNTPTVIPAPQMVGAFSYLVNKSAYSKIAKFATSFMTTFDDMMMHMISQKKINGYAYFPFMSFHNANESFVWDKTPGHLSHTNNMHSSYKYFKNKI